MCLWTPQHIMAAPHNIVRDFEEFVEEARAGATAEPQYVSMTQCYHDLHHLDHC